MSAQKKVSNHSELLILAANAEVKKLLQKKLDEAGVVPEDIDGVCKLLQINHLRDTGGALDKKSFNHVVRNLQVIINLIGQLTSS